MTQSLLCYKVLSTHDVVVEDLPQLVDLSRGRHRLRQASSHHTVQASGALPTVVSRSVFHHSSPTVGSGLLVVADVVGSSTWRAGVVALWNASVDDTASTYFVATHSKIWFCKLDSNIDDLLFFMKN
jgi:hypothetical protein